MRFSILVVAAILAAAPAAHSAQKAAETPPQWTTYACADGLIFKVRFALGMAQMHLEDGRQFVLPRAISASGARYADDVAEFWNKGRDAMLSIGPEPKRDCRVAE